MENLKELSNEDLAEFVHEQLLNIESDNESNPDFIHVCGVYHQILGVRESPIITAESQFIIHVQSVPSLYETDFRASREFVEELAHKLDVFLEDCRQQKLLED